MWSMHMTPTLRRNCRLMTPSCGRALCTVASQNQKKREKDWASYYEIPSKNASVTLERNRSYYIFVMLAGCLLAFYLIRIPAPVTWQLCERKYAACWNMERLSYILAFFAIKQRLVCPLWNGDLRTAVRLLNRVFHAHHTAGVYTTARRYNARSYLNRQGWGLGLGPLQC